MIIVKSDAELRREYYETEKTAEELAAEELDFWNDLY